MAYFHIKTSDEVLKIKGDDFELDADDNLQIFLDNKIVAMFIKWDFFYSEQIEEK